MLMALVAYLLLYPISWLIPLALAVANVRTKTPTTKGKLNTIKETKFIDIHHDKLPAYGAAIGSWENAIVCEDEDAECFICGCQRDVVKFCYYGTQGKAKATKKKPKTSCLKTFCEYHWKSKGKCVEHNVTVEEREETLHEECGKNFYLSHGY